MTKLVPYLSFNHLSYNGLVPKFLGSTHTIPHLEIVAGVAYCKSDTSNIMAQCD